jgi:GT2 family glycosyltransferase
LSGIAVVIPNWNGREHLRACLESLPLAGGADEIIVIDNGSADGSTEMLRADFPHVTLVRNETNRGFAAACNQGAAAASAEFVAFLNNDARVAENWLVPLVRALETQPDLAAVGSLVLDWEGKRIDFGRSGLTPLARGVQLDFGVPVRDAPDQSSEQLFANGAAMLVRREVFLQVGGFDERFFAYYEDVDLGWRLWVLGWRVLLEPASRVFHRHHGTSRRLGRDKVSFLMTRNAIATAVKNVDDQTFAALVPVLLLDEVAGLASDLGPSERLHPTGFGEFAYHQSQQEPLGGRARQALGATARSVYQRETTARTRVARSMLRLIDPGSTVVNSATQASLAALDEVLWGWPDLLAARSQIQTKRKRSDHEIAGMFGLETQRRRRRRDAISPDPTREAVFRALEAASLGWLLPRA